jgi:hypothetical protein
MTKHEHGIDGLVGTLKRVDDEQLTSASQTQAAQALYKEVVTVRSQASSRSGPRRNRRRLAWQGAMVAAAAVIVLTVLSIVNVFGADGPSIVDKAMAALDPSGNAIVHAKITGSESTGDGYASDWVEESWILTSAPYTRRDIRAFADSPIEETVQDGNGLLQTYVVATNTIYRPQATGGSGYKEGDPNPYTGMILPMLQSGEAVVEGSETIDGRECVVIAATKERGTRSDGTAYGTWYVVDAETNYPVEWRMAPYGGGSVIVHFDVYEQLPVDETSLALLDLAAQHPGAAVSTSLEDH